LSKLAWCDLANANCKDCCASKYFITPPGGKNQDYNACIAYCEQKDTRMPPKGKITTLRICLEKPWVQFCWLLLSVVSPCAFGKRARRKNRQRAAAAGGTRPARWARCGREGCRPGRGVRWSRSFRADNSKATSPGAGP
jgi:hypothetical protein